MGILLDTAKFWLNQGIATIPIYYKQKQPKIKWLPYTENLPTEGDITAWFLTDIIPTNIGIIAGWNDLTILDFDNLDRYKDWYRWVKTSENDIVRQIAKETRSVISSRGIHLYIYCADAKNMKMNGIDILAKRKYALIPPSIHPNGTKYTLYRDVMPIRVQRFNDLFPSDWLKCAQIERTANQKQSVNKSTPIPPHTENKTPNAWTIAGTEDNIKDTIERIKQHYRIEDFFSAASLKDSGNGYKMTCCPFHDDHNPSFWIDTKKQICGCHSGCTMEPLDVIDLYARLKNISNQQAIHKLARTIA